MAYMARIKSIGERGSPYRISHRCKIMPPGIPFTSTLVEVEYSSPLIISLHICPKPMCRITSSKKGHETESKALEMSNLRRIRG
jgi:hypothetical protein